MWYTGFCEKKEVELCHSGLSRISYRSNVSDSGPDVRRPPARQGWIGQNDERDHTMKTLITTSFEETRQFGKDFAAQLKGGEVLALHGDLGSGKTTFVQGLAKGLGIEQRIISPTFIIMRSYEVKHSSLSEQGESKGLRQAQAKMFYHVDLYRIETEKDVEGVGLFDLIGDPENIMVIEWPEKIEHLLPEKRIDLSFKYLDEDKREIKVL